MWIFNNRIKNMSLVWTPCHFHLCVNFWPLLCMWIRPLPSELLIPSRWNVFEMTWYIKAHSSEMKLHLKALVFLWSITVLVRCCITLIEHVLESAVVWSGSRTSRHKLKAISLFSSIVHCSFSQRRLKEKQRKNK